MSKILIVEDEKNQRELYAAELEEEGYEVVQVSNGSEALKMVATTKFDLVVLDIRMAEMGGIETLGRLISKDKNIPILIYTAYTQYRNNFVTWTADDFLTKSSNLDELKNKVREVIINRSI